jgi:hypothetical protein
MKKEYNIPTIETIDMRGEYPLMAIAASKTYWAAPPRRDKMF